MNNIIEIKDLTKYYGKTKGIENLSLDIKEGEIFGYIGPNGAGKSTTIRLMLSLIFPDSGSVKIFGLDAFKNSDIISQEIGYLPSEVFYYENMKVKDFFKYNASFYQRDCKKRTKELCEILELDENRKIRSLSYGNRKKVGIIQGLMHQPRILILDEPTGGLDPLMQKRFFDLIKEENQRGTTVLFSSHILSEVRRICDRVGLIKDGQLIQVSTIQEIFSQSYKKIEIETKDSKYISLKELEGVSKFSLEGSKVHFLYQGQLDVLLSKLNEIKITDLLISEPELEEIFLQYYEK
ncbi:MAG: ABC transporter ATP-binding protein [Sphaerochaetaceae bacterium]